MDKAPDLSTQKPNSQLPMTFFTSSESMAATNTSASATPFSSITTKFKNPTQIPTINIKCCRSFEDAKVRDFGLTRRGFVGFMSSAVTVFDSHGVFNDAAAAAREVDVGAFLPPLPSDPSFVQFTASAKDTPALRAGNVQPYKFIIPPTWKQTRVSNILSGNYCQPKCAEPWVEVKFENEKQGKIQVVASPLIRLTNKPNATIEEIGDPEKLIASLGAFVTGNTYDPDELIEATTEKRGDLTYYKYVLETPFALTGSHNLAKATAKGNTVILFVVSANDKQWQTSEKILKAMLDSFEV